MTGRIYIEKKQQLTSTEMIILAKQRKLMKLKDEKLTKNPDTRKIAEREREDAHESIHKTKFGKSEKRNK